MSIRFCWLWFIWGTGLAYDLVVSTFGFFPDRPLADRMSSQAGIAWFIFTAWLIAWLLGRSADVGGSRDG